MTHNNKRLPGLLAPLIILLMFGGIFAISNLNKEGEGETKQIKNSDISYIPFGDSFTIGLGVAEPHRWPNMMVENFAKEDISIKILENPAVSGYTVRDMINFELPILETLRPDFVTVFIGTNDSFVQKDVVVFEKDYKELLDKIQKLLPDPKSMVLITIPDYSKFPALKHYRRINYSESITSYNEIIRQESVERDLILADIYPVSQKMTDEQDFIPDGLHPSVEGYVKWERVIYPKVRELLLLRTPLELFNL